MSSIIERIYEIIEKNGVSVSSFSNDIGVSNGYLAKQRGNSANVGSHIIEKIVIRHPEISLKWLITGNGSMLKDDNCLLTSIKCNVDSKGVDRFADAGTMILASAPNQGIPLIPFDSMAGYFGGEQTALEYECEKYVVPMFRDAEFLISVRGSSMCPKYNSGDIVACRRLLLNDLFFQWNKVYVLDTAQGALIKRVKRGSNDDNVLIVSDNDKYEPFELHKAAINSVAIVIGVIRLE